MYGVKIKVLITLTFCLSSAATQTCDSSSDVTQCSDGEICRSNRCEYALICGGDDYNPCPANPGLTCVTNYCQPNSCNSIGQCVHGQVCSQDGTKRCVYPSVYHIKEGSEFTLAFEEPELPGSYEEIQWYKGGRSNTDRVAVTDSKTQYYGDFCTGNSPCRESGRAHLNRDTGDLTIKNMTLRDEGFYYYNFSGYDNFPDTGYKYEYKLNVYVTPALTIQGIPDNYVEVGTNLTLTCTADRIRPEPLAMYWEINGRNMTGNLTADADGDGVFSQTIVYIHKVTKEDEGNPIKCAVVPRFTDQSRKDFKVEKSVNPGYYAGLITACLIGVLVLVALVIVAVIVCKRYKVKFSMYNKFWLGREREDNIEICESLDSDV